MQLSSAAKHAREILYDVTDITSQNTFIPAILVQVGETLWEVMDENDDNMIEQLQWDGNEGIINMMGMYIHHPDQSFCSFFQAQTNKQQGKEQSRAESPNKSATPRCKEMQKRAHENLMKAVSLVKKQILQDAGDNKVCEVGEVVQC